MVPAPVETIWDNHLHAHAVTYLLAVRDDDGAVVGTVTGVDHELLFSDPEHGSSLWTLAVDPAAGVPGVGEALTRALAEHFRRAGRAYMDLSVAHDNAAAIGLYEKLGFRRVPVLAIKRKNAINEPLFSSAAGDGRRPQSLRADHRRRGAAPRNLGRGPRRRDRRDATHPRWSQRDHPRIAVRVHLGDRHVPLRRQAADPAAGLRGRHHRARVPAWPPSTTATTTSCREVGEVVVKPTRGEQGKGITVGVTADSGPDELAAALARAREQYPEVLIEQRVSGDDLRLVVIDGRVVAAALRLPPEIIGTGDHSVRELIVAESRRRSAATGGESRIPLDEVTEATVAEAGWKLDDVLPQGTRLRVRHTANLHQGGTIHDVTAAGEPGAVSGRGGGGRGDRHPGDGHRPPGPRRHRRGLRLHRSQRATGPGQPRTTTHGRGFHRLPVSRSARPAAGLDSRGIAALDRRLI